MALEKNWDLKPKQFYYISQWSTFELNPNVNIIETKIMGEI